jgi:hypothetical protein
MFGSFAFPFFLSLVTYLSAHCWIMLTQGIIIHYEKIKFFATKLANGFWNCNDHLQPYVFVQCECYWMSSKCCNGFIEIIYICNSCNYCAIMLQLWCNYTSNDMLMWFLSIHPGLNLFMSITTSLQWKVIKKNKNIAITWQLVNNTYLCIWIVLCDYGPTLIHLFATRCFFIGPI